jgi:CPA2 family monovalent cation:H+ antiporter-2
MDHVILEIGLALMLIGIALGVASKLKLSNVPFLIIIGMIVGPHAPQIGVFDFRFIQTGTLITFMGQLGVLFLLFYLGLEANVTRLIEAGPSILTGGTIYILTNFALGLLYAFLVGFSAARDTDRGRSGHHFIECHRREDPLRLSPHGESGNELILGITMFEDIFLAVYLSLISGIVLSGASSITGVLSSGGIALGFIVGLMAIGRWSIPLLNRVLQISSNEVFIIVVFGSLFLLAGLGETIHVAESIGALLMGLILGETKQAERMERLVVPFRDFFGAIFFFSFGLSIDPFTLGGAAWMAVGAALLSLVSVIAAGMLVGWRAKLSPVGSLNLSFTLLARGEFSIIIASLAQAGGLLGILQPFAALYVLILAGASPLLAKESERVYETTMKIVRWRPKRKPRPEEAAEQEQE